MPATTDSSRGDRQPAKRGAEVNTAVIDYFPESKKSKFRYVCQVSSDQQPEWFRRLHFADTGGAGG
jgi:hypothetical protein